MGKPICANRVTFGRADQLIRVQIDRVRENNNSWGIRNHFGGKWTEWKKKFDFSIF